VSITGFVRNDKRLVPQARLAIVSYVIVGCRALSAAGLLSCRLSTFPIATRTWQSASGSVDSHHRPARTHVGSAMDACWWTTTPASLLLLRDDPAVVDKIFPAIADVLGIPPSTIFTKQLNATKPLPQFQLSLLKPKPDQS